MEMGVLRTPHNLISKKGDENMTKTQKLILIVLTINAVLLGFGLIVLYRYIGNQPQQAVEPIEIPVQHIEIEPTSSASPNPTLPVIEITIPAPDESPDTTAYPIIDETIYTATPTPEHAYVYLPTAAPAVTAVPSVPSGMAFTLSVLGKVVNVANNVDEDTLEKHPGWLPTSARPGEEGICVVYGHRNRNHLLILKEIEVGDEIYIVLPDGRVYTYIVDKTEIISTEEAIRIPTIEGTHLILMTCYPFYYSGHAPQKFVVTCFLKTN